MVRTYHHKAPKPQPLPDDTALAALLTKFNLPPEALPLLKRKLAIIKRNREEPETVALSSSQYNERIAEVAQAKALLSSLDRDADVDETFVYAETALETKRGTPSHEWQPMLILHMRGVWADYRTDDPTAFVNAIIKAWFGNLYSDASVRHWYRRCIKF